MWTIWHLLHAQVGTSFDWSVVVHAYGNPMTSNWALRQPYQAYTFADLPFVTAYQQQALKNLSIPNPAIAPQAMLAASEQGWNTYGSGAVSTPPVFQLNSFSSGFQESMCTGGRDALCLHACLDRWHRWGQRL